MERKSILDCSGHSFMAKFRNGFATILSEVKKLKHISSNLNKLEQHNKYFQDCTNDLGQLYAVLDEIRSLNDDISKQALNLDSVEQSLLSLRARFIDIEENPELLALGYQPFIPPELLSTDLNDSDDKKPLHLQSSFEPVEVEAKFPLTPSNKQFHHGQEPYENRQEVIINSTTKFRITNRKSIVQKEMNNIENKENFISQDVKHDKSLHILDRLKTSEKLTGKQSPTVSTYTDQTHSDLSIQGAISRNVTYTSLNFSLEQSPAQFKLSSSPLVEENNTTIGSISKSSNNVFKSGTFTRRPRFKTDNDINSTASVNNYLNNELTPKLYNKSSHQIFK